MKYAIAENDKDGRIVFYCGVVTNPEGHWMFKASRSLKYASIYDTSKDAEDVINCYSPVGTFQYNPNLSRHEILTIPEKELFIARLKG